MATTVKLGTLLLDGTDAKSGAKYQSGQSICFGEGNTIQWVIVNSLLIANQSLLVDISWEDLSKQNLVLGKTVLLNGQRFICRLLKVGTSETEVNEWDDALDVAGDETTLWHWKGSCFWGQENPAPSRCVLRGYHSARYWYCDSSSRRYETLGFRPVLELQPSDHLVYGTEICAIGGQSVLYGKLLEVTAYDVVIKPEAGSKLSKTDMGSLYTKLPDGMVIIDRTQMKVQSIREE